MSPASSKTTNNGVLLVTNIPTPYRIPLFNDLNKRLNEQGFKLKVVFGGLAYSHRKWIVDLSKCGFSYVVLRDQRLPYADPEKTSFTYPGLWRLVADERPAVIITNAFSIATTKLWWRSLFRPTPYVIWSGAVQDGDRPGSRLRRIQRTRVVKRARGFIAYGTKAKHYLVGLGAAQKRVVIGINTVDTEFYAVEANRFRKCQQMNDQKHHLLYIGDLSPRKNVTKLLKVIIALSNTRSDFVLDVVGDGEDYDQLEKYVEDNGLHDFVMFYGYKQQSEILEYLGRAACFLFQTDFDIWGLVLVEAMAAALPCIASTHAGATHDLIEDGVTGFAMDFSKTETVAERINWILEHPESAREIGRRASGFVRKHVSIEKSAAGFVEAILASQQLEEQRVIPDSSLVQKSLR